MARYRSAQKALDLCMDGLGAHLFSRAKNGHDSGTHSAEASSAVWPAAVSFSVLRGCFTRSSTCETLEEVTEGVV
jgi:hypothetical protein